VSRSAEEEGVPNTEDQRESGATLVELLFVVTVSVVIAAMAVPSVLSTVRLYRLSAAVTAATTAIQSTRYLAIMRGYPYRLAFDPTTLTYQLSNLPAGTTYANVGGPIPLLGGAGLTLNPATTLQFKPNGTVSATTGSLTFSLTYAGRTRVITVSMNGNASVN
jgi:Tfp pilus assembly protein FimT